MDAPGQFQTVALTFQFARKQSLTMHRALGEARDTDTAPTVRRALRISSVKGGIACDSGDVVAIQDILGVRCRSARRRRSQYRVHLAHVAAMQKFRNGSNRSCKGVMMSVFDWVVSEVMQAPVTFDGSVTVPIGDFRRQSGLEEDADWVRDANSWGARQSPKVEFELTQDGTGVVIRRET